MCFKDLIDYFHCVLWIFLYESYSISIVAFIDLYVTMQCISSMSLLRCSVNYQAPVSMYSL